MRRVSLNGWDGFPGRLRAEREAQGLGVVELDELAGVGAGRVSRCEEGKAMKRIAFLTVAKLAAALGVRLTWLAFGELPKTLSETPTRIIVESTVPDADHIRRIVLAELEARENRRE